MVQHCFNPACRREFQLLHAGDLYALESASADTEFFWLCSDCACKFDLAVTGSGVVELSARGQRRAHTRPAREGELRLVSRCARPAPRLDSRPTSERRYRFMLGADPHHSRFRPLSAVRNQEQTKTTAAESAA